MVKTKKKAGQSCSVTRFIIYLFLVGARGFEPPTPSSRTRCATRLRYAPTISVNDDEAPEPDHAFAGESDDNSGYHYATKYADRSIPALYPKYICCYGSCPGPCDGKGYCHKQSEANRLISLYELAPPPRPGKQPCKEPIKQPVPSQEIRHGFQEKQERYHGDEVTSQGDGIYLGDRHVVMDEAQRYGSSQFKYGKHRRYEDSSLPGKSRKPRSCIPQRY